jgi:hypothetical protein
MRMSRRNGLAAAAIPKMACLVAWVVSMAEGLAVGGGQSGTPSSRCPDDLQADFVLDDQAPVTLAAAQSKSIDFMSCLAAVQVTE